MDDVTLLCGDGLAILPTLEANSADAIVTDPPYGLEFMGRDWDHGIPGMRFWQEALRVAKPGAHLLAFGGTRTFHRLACAIEDAGWEIRDTVMWVYGSGFPKSMDVSKAIDKAAGAERLDAIKGGHMGISTSGGDRRNGNADAWHTQEWHGQIDKGGMTRGTPATPDAARWSGWGTALKPAWEPIIVARKPIEGTVAENVLKWGTGGINIDGCRVEGIVPQVTQGLSKHIYGGGNGLRKERAVSNPHPSGRWPANLIHDGSDEVTAGFPVTGVSKGIARFKTHTTYQWSVSHPDATTEPQNGQEIGYGDTGSASRFFYCAKASKADRDEGCEGLEERVVTDDDKWATNDRRNGTDRQPTEWKAGPRRNHHPTVKPTALMRYLCRLVTPPDGLILDPFMGSGSTGKAAVLEGFRFLGIDQDPEYCEIARRRIAAVQQAFPLFAVADMEQADATATE